ncbi:23S rRNA (uracil(1939)-C(5))-methyltransferase RlmD [Eggerthellaceae bacterium 3-80]|nr:23S rRNA (uracil(1939)-C(5))-methyltransferase RlmD [bacterium D16-34]
MANRKQSDKRKQKSVKPGIKVAPCPSSRCPVAHLCGGCQQIDVPYQEQLASKRATIQELYADILDATCVDAVVGMADPFHYRNKVTSPFAPGRRLYSKQASSQNATRTSASKRTSSAKQKGKKNALTHEVLCGMYAQGTHEIIPTDQCLIENEQAKQVICAIKDLMASFGYEPYNENTGSGLIRHVIVRVGHTSGEVLVTIVTNAQTLVGSKAFCRELVKRCPFITTIVQNINERQTNVVLGEKERVLYGSGFILDKLCGLSFRISSQSFYQVNAVQTEVLYKTALELAALDDACVVLDAYCGTGTIGLVAARMGAHRVIGVDSVRSAIRDAKENARHNGIENARFFARDATEFLCEMAERQEHVDVVLMDPPRAGSTEEFLDSVARLAPERVVYISCNPTTQKRDIAYLIRQGYQLERVVPVDMFPHTEHIETIALITKVPAAHASQSSELRDVSANVHTGGKSV